MLKVSDAASIAALTWLPTRNQQCKDGLPRPQELRLEQQRSSLLSAENLLEKKDQLADCAVAEGRVWGQWEEGEDNERA